MHPTAVLLALRGMTIQKNIKYDRYVVSPRATIPAPCIHRPSDQDGYGGWGKGALRAKAVYHPCTWTDVPDEWWDSFPLFLIDQYLDSRSD